MTFVNLTPHEIHEATTDLIIPSTGIARINMASKEVANYDGISIYKSEYTGSLQGLPAPKVDTIYIVSALTLNAVPSYRTDVVAPGNLIRDEHGKPSACQGFRIKS